MEEHSYIYMNQIKLFHIYKQAYDHRKPEIIMKLYHSLHVESAL